MGLKSKKLDEILGDMVSWVTTNTNKLTDFNVGSASRTLLEAVSLQLEEFYYKMHDNVMWATENSIYNAFGFQTRQETAAKGEIQITFSFALSEPHTLKEGTRFSSNYGIGSIKYYHATKDWFIPSGSESATIEVESMEPGEYGNTPANTVTNMVSPLPFVDHVTNPEGIFGGQSTETKSERKQRFLQYIQTLARGTSDAITYGCLEVEGVQGAWVDDAFAGFVRAYVHDATGGLPEELKTRVEENLINYRAAGVEVVVLPIEPLYVDLEMNVVLNDQYDENVYEQPISESITQFINSFPVSKNLYMSELTQRIMNLHRGVVIHVEVVGDSQSFIPHSQELIRMGNLDLNIYSASEWGES